MERRIGEEFTINGKTYIVKETDDSCVGCAFCRKGDNKCMANYVVSRREIGDCASPCREDEKSVIFEEIVENNKVNSMKPFNLEEAKAGKPVCTKEGKNARILCFDLKHKTYKIAAAISIDEDTEYIETFDNDGKCNSSSDVNDFDLMMVSEKKKGVLGIIKFVNDEDSSIRATTTCIYDTEDALRGINTNVIAVLPIEWEE